VRRRPQLSGRVGDAARRRGQPAAQAQPVRALTWVVGHRGRDLLGPGEQLSGLAGETGVESGGCRLAQAAGPVGGTG
jgi:hypothetical protein